MSLLKADNLTVENMMLNSFGEANHHRNLNSVRNELRLVEKQIMYIGDEHIDDNIQGLVEFYDRAHNYLQCRTEIMVCRAQILIYPCYM